MSFDLLPWNFLYVLGRTSVLVAFLPMFGEAQVPKSVRAGLAIWVSLAIFPILPATTFRPLDVPDVALAVGMECVLGAIFAIVLRMILSSVMLGAQWIDSEIGFQAAQQINPLSGIPSSPVTTLVIVVASMIFWCCGYFEDMLMYWAKIFLLLPPPFLAISPFAGDTLVQISSQIFTGALQIAAPIMLIMFLVSVAVGLMARALQGINILVEGFNIKLLVGLISLVALTPLIIKLLQKQLSLLPNFWEAMVRVLRAPY